MKLHAMVGVLTNIVVAVELTDGHRHDSPYFAPLVESTADNFTIRDMTADKAYSSKANLQLVADKGGMPYIPFRGGIPAYQRVMPRLPETTSVFYRMQHYFAFQRDTFLSHYHKRSNVETTFSMIKRKFGGNLRSKSEVGQMNEVLCKVIAHNLCCLIMAIHEIGMPEPEFATA